MPKHLHDYHRNLAVLVIACLLNFAFAFEKFLIVIEHPWSDKTWMFIYGGISIILSAVAYYDYKWDVKEDKHTTTNII